MSLNRCEFIGRLGADPEIRNMPDGKSVASLSLACGEKWKDKETGETKEKTEWIRFSVFGPVVDTVVVPYLHKGDRVYLAGKFVTRKWVDKAGVERYSSEIKLAGFDSKIELLDNKPSDVGSPQPTAPATTESNSGYVPF